MSKPLLLLLLILVFGISSFDYSEEKKSEGVIVITNASVIDMENGSISKRMSLLIEQGIISEIGPTGDVKIPSKAKIIDGSGKYLIPGLWDMHAHTSSEAITRKIFYPLYIANGITGIRVMSADCFEPCWELDMSIDQSRKLQDEVRNGMLIGPRAILGSTYIHGAQPGELSTVQAPGTKEDAKKLVNLLFERGVDFIKIYDEVPREAYFGIAEEANRKGLPFAGHVPTAVRASEASDAGQKSIEHCCAGDVFEECSTEE